MLGKSVLPRVLVRVTLLLPAHLPVLIGQRVSHSGGCRCRLVFARALTLTLVLTTGLITIFILVISVIGKWSVFGVLGARTHTNHLLTDSVSGPYFCMLMFSVYVGLG